MNKTRNLTVVTALITAAATLAACDSGDRRYRPGKKGLYDFTIRAPEPARDEPATTAAAAPPEAAAVAAATPQDTPKPPPPKPVEVAAESKPATPAANIEPTPAPQPPPQAAAKPAAAAKPDPEPKSAAPAPRAQPSASPAPRAIDTADLSAPKPRATAAPLPPKVDEFALKPGELPSLQSELSAKSRRDADELRTKLGIRLDMVKTAPAWIAEAGTKDEQSQLISYIGTGRGQALETAYNAAVSSVQKQAADAAGGTARAVDITKASFARGPLGDITVWVHGRAK